MSESAERVGYEIQTPCECQAILGATLNAERLVLEGWVTGPLGGDREAAPAHSIKPQRERFDVAWNCPRCGRNTLRTFAASALRRVELPVPPAPPAEAAEEA